ncbi:hypothetical protein G6F32_016517 [Rhizopus arrhizus]|nr:hypothetical protein G6F32_016517 [Rhizopus arrhizus]
MTPNQGVIRKSGTPLSAKVGTSGMAGARWRLATARARSLPARMLASDAGRLSKYMSTCPPSRAAATWPAPL